VPSICPSDIDAMTGIGRGSNSDQNHQTQRREGEHARDHQNEAEDAIVFHNAPPASMPSAAFDCQDRQLPWGN
jgi:hypothetical protein